MKRITIVLVDGVSLSMVGTVHMALTRFANAIGSWEEILYIEEV